jgi:hypothetical protein
MPTYQARKRPASGKAANEKRNQRAFVLARELMATEAALAATSNGVGDDTASKAVGGKRSSLMDKKSMVKLHKC